MLINCLIKNVIQRDQPEKKIRVIWFGIQVQSIRVSRLRNDQWKGVKRFIRKKIQIELNCVPVNKYYINPKQSYKICESIESASKIVCYCNLAQVCNECDHHITNIIINTNTRILIIRGIMNSWAIITLAAVFCVLAINVDTAAAARRHMPALLEEDGVRKTNRSAGQSWIHSLFFF